MTLRLWERETDSREAPDVVNPAAQERFRDLRWLKNHWSRPIGPRSYYWYLTFENSPELHSLARKCQEAIAFPYYDLMSTRDLHLTLDRIGFDGDITPVQLDAVEAAARLTCHEIPPFNITIGSLGGTRGAIGFDASPVQPIKHLRDSLRATTLSAYPGAPVKRSEFHPHITIAYANSDGIPAAPVIAVTEKLHAEACADVTIKEAALVLLERRPRSYAWQATTRIPLAG